MNDILCKKIISTILSLNIFLTACGSTLDNKKDSELSNSTITNNNVGYSHVTDESVTTEVVKEEIDVLPLSINIEMLSEKIIINSEDLENFKECIRKIIVKYPYEKYYSKEYNVKKYNPSFNNDRIIKNNRVDEDKLYSYVIKNNEDYLKTYGSSNYKNTTNDFVKKICNIITEQLNNYLQNCELDVDLLEEKLQTLSIFNYKSFAKGLYKQKNNVLAINANDCTYEIIYHELDHLIQSASSNEIKESNIESRNGYCYKETNEGINPYNWTWFIESCAESMAINDSSEATVYTSELKMLEAMKLITLSNNYDLEESLYLNDIDKLYDFFGAYTEDEKQEINKMFYITTVINNNNPGSEGDEFYKKIKEDTGESLAYTDYESKLIGYVATTEAKIFYDHLIQEMENKEVTLNDIFNIISVFEIELSRQTWYQSNYINLDDFMEEYNDIQKYFFAIISKKLDIDSNTLSTMFNNYYNSIDVNSLNINIDWLTLNVNEFLNYIVKSRTYDKVSKTISSTYNNDQIVSRR